MLPGARSEVELAVKKRGRPDIIVRKLDTRQPPRIAAPTPEETQRLPFPNGKSYTMLCTISKLDRVFDKRSGFVIVITWIRNVCIKVTKCGVAASYVYAPSQASE
jgi:hypothetical protein